MNTLIIGEKVDGSGQLPIPVSNDGLTIPVSGTITATSGIGASAVPADATTNAAATSGLLQSFLSAFNGTTWDRVRAGVTTVSATFTGMLNSLPWGIFHTSPTTRTNGQGGPLETDASGNLRTAEQFLAASTATNITSATTTVVHSGSGRLARIVIGTLVATATITIYDNTAASGTKIGIITLPAAGAGDMPTAVEYGCAFSTGLTVVTSGATDITVIWD